MDVRKLRSTTALALLAFAGATAAKGQSQDHFVLDLPSEPLSQALKDVAVQTGHDVIAPADLVGTQPAPPLSGTFTAEQAVARLLAGTGLRYRMVDGALVVERGPFADTVGRAAGSEPAGSAITVTGTRIRGGGSASPVTVTTRRNLEVAGINDLADFTRILPQNYTGGQNRGIPGGGEQGGQQNLNNSATLNLRGLGPDATLTLLDGHRLSYDTVNQGIDISAIPLAAIERVEVVADGASALYGSDAVGGVANIILRNDFQGLEATARTGASTDGGNVQQEVSLVGGRRWSTGGFMLALDENSATPIYAGQRGYTRSVDPSLTLTDRNRQWSGVFSGHQQLSRAVSLSMDGYLMDRRSLLQNPFLPTADVHQYGIVTRPHVRSYAVTPALRADVGRWQASLSATSADSRTLTDGYNYAGGAARHVHLLFDDTLKGGEATAEGPLVALPGGDARLAVGGGLRGISLHERYQLLTGGQSVTTKDFTERRNVQFAYAELSLPLARPELDLPMLNRLMLSGALRWEHWNGIAAVTTPKLGLVYQPVRDVTVRATWGKSFKIPTLLQVNTPEEGDLIPGVYFSPSPQPAGSTVLLLSGSSPHLKPERATTWSATAEVTPRFVPGLDLHATYFRIDYRGRIAAPLPDPTTVLFNPLFSDLIIYNPSAADVNALVASLPGGLVNETGAPFDPSQVGAIIDEARRNTERQEIHGVDLSLDDRVDLARAGRLQLTASASYLASKQRLRPNFPVIQLAGRIFHPPHWRGRAGAVWELKRTGLSAFVNYVGPRLDDRLSPAVRVGSFVTLDLNASLRTGSQNGALRNVELRLSAMNLLNAKPNTTRKVYPEEAPFDATNESAVGRFVGASIRKAW